jgi:NAD(P)-dependent dehydrogenase (short-subunit alcohol dehydrogenase family)
MALPATLFEATFSDAVAELREHRLYGTLVVPGAAYLTMALLAAASVTGRAACTLEGIAFREPLLLEADTAYSVQTILSREQDGAMSVEIFSRCPPDGDWRLHSAGVIRSGPSAGAAPVTASDRALILSRCPEELSGEQFYALMAEGDSSLGPSFRWVERLQRGAGEALARLRLPRAEERTGGTHLPPGLLDACFQVFGATWPTAEREPVVYVPVGLEQLNYFEAAAEAQWCYARLRPERAAGQFVGDVTLCDAAGRLLVEITGLRVMAASRASLLRPQIANVADWLYAIRWQLLAMPHSQEPSSEAGSWLILADDAGFGDALQPILTAHGINSRLVRRQELDLTRPEALGEALAPLADAASPCRTLVCLWPLDVPVEAEASEVPVSICRDALLLIQALARLSASVVPRLWLVTRKAQAVVPDQAGVAASPALLWGFGRTVARELPDVWGGLIDLDDMDKFAAARLVELVRDAREDQLALRAGQCYAARLERIPPAPEAQRRPLDSDGVYLITGGLGAVGLALAHWLVANGARRLALVGRHAGPNAATAELEHQGASVFVAPCDVTQAGEVTRLLAQPELTGLRGIIHAAGVLDDGALVQLTPERMASVLAPKVSGSWNLHCQTRGLALDFFVVCSSAVAVLGSAGQANYAAANAFLDALAHQRQASGLPALSVNWGPFAQAGMAARALAAQPRRNSLPGLDPIVLEQAGPILGRLLAQGLAQAAVLPIRLRDLPRLMGPRTSLLASSAHQLDLLERPAAEAPPELARRLAEAHPAHRAQLLLANVIEQAASVLLLQTAQTLDPRRPLREYGLDSLMALDLSAALSRMIGRKLPATLVYEQPTAEALAVYLAHELGLEESAPAAPADDQRSAAIAEVQQLSETELDEFVSETLKSR